MYRIIATINNGFGYYTQTKEFSTFAEQKAFSKHIKTIVDIRQGLLEYNWQTIRYEYPSGKSYTEKRYTSMAR